MHSQAVPGADGPARALPALADRLKSLRCLAAVAAQGSTMRAALAMHLSQPAVTRSILDLERHLGLALFERGARGMAPTALGARLAARAAQVQRLLALGAAEAQRLSAPAQRHAPTPARFAGSVAPASLKALLAVAALASESAAALALGISQPAVHRSLRVLEDACGAALYMKSARGTRLTDSGGALLRRVKLALAEMRAMESELASWRGQVQGRVVVGALPLSVHLVLPQAVATVLQRHADIAITVVDGTYDSLMHQLRSADVDLVLGALRTQPPPEVAQEALFQDDLVVVARPGHPCLRTRRLGLAQLLRWPWVVPLPATPARMALERAFAAEGLAPPPDHLQATSAQYTRTLVASTEALALASRLQALEDVRLGLLCVVPVPLAGSTRSIGMALRGNSEPSPDLQALLQALREQAQQLAA